MNKACGIDGILFELFHSYGNASFNMPGILENSTVDTELGKFIRFHRKAMPKTVHTAIQLPSSQTEAK